jgi:glycine betaine/proline transport system permease protein
LGDAAESRTNWFIDSCAWLYEPLADGLENMFSEILYWLTAIPAPTLVLGLVVAVWCARGVQVAALTAATTAVAVSFGLWEETKETLALMTIAVGVSSVLGIAVAVAASLNKRLEALVWTVLDATQTYPLFAYLVPAIVILGVGNASALVVTIIWAMPPITRMTIIGLRGVPSETVEAAIAYGATRGQVLRGVLLPLARPSIMAGLNQTSMFAMAMAIVASMIGASGLGEPVWTRHRVLQFGQALEAGIVLVLLAIIMDRVTRGDMVSRSRDRTGP